MTPLEPALQLWDCAPLRARITEATCTRNKAEARTREGKRCVNMLEACLTCPGVVALSQRPAARVKRDREMPAEPIGAGARRRGIRHKRINPSGATSRANGYGGAVAPRKPVRPPNTITARELAERIDRSPKRARQILRDAGIRPVGRCKVDSGPGHASFLFPRDAALAMLKARRQPGLGRLRRRLTWAVQRTARCRSRLVDAIEDEQEIRRELNLEETECTP